MSFEILDKSLCGRIGLLKTRHGNIKTPALLPVLNPVKQELSAQDVAKIGFDAVITNAYLLWKNMKGKPIDVHDHLNFSGPIMTDSGGYQILRYGTVEVKPEEIVEYEKLINSDVAVILDVPTGPDDDWNKAKESVEITLRRAIESNKIRDRERLWVGPIQGGKYLDLVKLSAESMSQHGFDIYAVGSPTGLMEGYKFSTVLKMVIIAKSIIGSGNPMHLFGAGHPMFFPFMVAVGVDIFDSAAYALYAQNNRYMTSSGTFRINDLKELPCNCPVCSKTSADDVKNMSQEERKRFLMIHNLYVSLSEIKRIRQHITEGTLWELCEERSRAHPSLFKAMKVLVKFHKHLERCDPITKPVIHGLFFYNNETALRPQTYRHVMRIISNYSPESVKLIILLPPIISRPYIRSSTIKNIIQLINNTKYADSSCIAIVGDPFVFTPIELSEVYPLSQYEGIACSKTLSKIFIDNLSNLKFLNELEMAISVSDNHNNYLLSRINEHLRERGVKVIEVSLQKGDSVIKILRNVLSLL
ncbi:MAG: tRNA guanosine(15) transglycosylase TgtA [Thermoprotei archaeon]